MASAERVLVTGASGVVGGSILTVLLRDGGTNAVTMGRRRPAAIVDPHRHINVDLVDAAAVEDACDALRDDNRSQIGAAVFVAGIDSRQAITDVDSASMLRTMQVNCMSHLQILRHLARDARGRPEPLRVVAISSDVVNQATPQTVVYAATKAALEEALRQATSDVPLRVLLVRLSYIGVPMSETAECGDADRTEPRCPLPTTHPAVAAVASFIRPPEPRDEPPIAVWP